MTSKENTFVEFLVRLSSTSSGKERIQTCKAPTRCGVSASHHPGSNPGTGTDVFSRHGQENCG